ncbi:MAG: PHP domain-containing protein [Clostridia bacterium]|jgi:Uncharacterized conserved protein|nr:PHP domain-containing protein [Clostridia bacterium]MBR5751541.1 PHP domain-containing protein [Clostridia bacterium]
MKYAVDLHMHSCLSPCGDMDMTPNNIVNMCYLKGLELIAVTDHNTAGQLKSIKKVADAVGIGLVPGMELTTQEEAHMLAYFRTVEEAAAFSEEIYPHLPPIKNKPQLFGVQAYMNEDDEITGEEPRLLISALDLSVNKLFDMVTQRGGLAIPAHINRGSNGILQALGFLPPDVPFPALEVSVGLPLPHKGIPDVKQLHSSDAHYLENIFERTEFLDLSAPTADAFFDYILS